MDFFSGISGYVTTALGVIIALIVSYFRGKSTGKSQEKAERNEVITKQATEARQEQKHVQNEVASKDDDAVLAELESDWVRKPGGKGGR